MWSCTEKDGTFTRGSFYSMSFPLCYAIWRDNLHSPRWTSWKGGPNLGQETNEAEGRPALRSGQPPPETYKSEIWSQSTMCQVYTGAYLSLLAPEKADYTACHPRKITTYILHVVSITTHTHDRRKSIGKKEQRTNKKRKERKEKRRKRKKKTKKQRKKKKRQ